VDCDWLRNTMCLKRSKIVWRWFFIDNFKEKVWNTGRAISFLYSEVNAWAAKKKHRKIRIMLYIEARYCPWKLHNILSRSTISLTTYRRHYTDICLFHGWKLEILKILKIMNLCSFSLVYIVNRRHSGDWKSWTSGLIPMFFKLQTKLKCYLNKYTKYISKKKNSQ
jgi:hypothetical protein